MTQTGSTTPTNITPGGFFYLFALPPDHGHPEGVETVFYRLQGWTRAEFVRDTLQLIEKNAQVTYSCVPSSTFWPTTQELMRRIVKELEKRHAPDCDGCGLLPADPLFLRAQGFINARGMAKSVQQIPISAAADNPFPAEVLGDPLNLLLNELYLYAEQYDQILQAVAGGHGKKLDMEVNQTYAAVVAGLKFMLGCDDVQDAGLTLAPMVPHIGPASLRKLDWDAVLLESEGFFTSVGRFVRARGMYEPVPPSYEAYVMAGLRAKAAKNLEQAAAYGLPISTAPEKAQDVSTSAAQADLMATIKAGLEGIRDERIKAALREQEKQKTIEEMAEGADTFLAGLSGRLTDRERDLFFLLITRIPDGVNRRVMNFAEIGGRVASRRGKLTKQAIQKRVQSLYEKHPGVAGYVAAIRKPAKPRNFSELPPSERRKMGVDESYN
jgi:hypothetical protein